MNRILNNIFKLILIYVVILLQLHLKIKLYFAVIYKFSMIVCKLF